MGIPPEHVLRLVKADMPVMTDAQQLQIDAAQTFDPLLIFPAGRRHILPQTVGHKGVLRPDGYMIKQLLLHEVPVGLGMSRRLGVSATLFGALTEADVNVRMIDQGSSEMNIIVGVENDQFEAAIRAIYGAFVS